MSSGFMPQLEASSTSLGDAASAPMPSDASARTTGGNGLAFTENSTPKPGKTSCSAVAWAASVS